jgi:hypothetical protein
MTQLAARAVTRETEATVRVCVGVGRYGASSRLYVVPQPARQHPHRMQPSYDVFHPLGAAHMARHVNVASILSEISGLARRDRQKMVLERWTHPKALGTIVDRAAI